MGITFVSLSRPVVLSEIVRQVGLKFLIWTITRDTILLLHRESFDMCTSLFLITFNFFQCYSKLIQYFYELHSLFDLLHTLHLSWNLSSGQVQCHQLIMFLQLASDTLCSTFVARSPICFYGFARAFAKAKLWRRNLPGLSRAFRAIPAARYLFGTGETERARKAIRHALAACSRNGKRYYPAKRGKWRGFAEKSKYVFVRTSWLNLKCLLQYSSFGFVHKTSINLL